MSRAYTNKLQDLVDEGYISESALWNEMMKYLSECEVKAFCLDSFGGELRDEFDGL